MGCQYQINTAKGPFPHPSFPFKQLWYTKPQLSGVISLNSQQGQRSACSFNLDSLRPYRLPALKDSSCARLKSVLKSSPEGSRVDKWLTSFVLHLDKEYNGWTHSRSEARWCKTHSKHHNELGSAPALTEHFFLNKGTRYRVLYWQGRL